MGSTRRRWGWPCMVSIASRAGYVPSSISGKPVRRSTVMTGTPAASMALALPPVDTISYPASASPWIRRLPPFSDLSRMPSTAASLVGIVARSKTHYVFDVTSRGMSMESSTTFASSVSPLLSETEMRAFLEAALAAMPVRTGPMGRSGARHARLQSLPHTCTCASCCCQAHPAATPAQTQSSGNLSTHHVYINGDTSVFYLRDLCSASLTMAGLANRCCDAASQVAVIGCLRKQEENIREDSLAATKLWQYGRA